MKEIGLVVLGAILASFAPLLSELILKPYRKGKLKKSLIIELIDLRHKLASVAMQLATSHGTINRELMEWEASILFSGEHQYDNPSLKEVTTQMLSLDDKDIELAFKSSEYAQVKAFKLKKYYLPFLSSQIPSLSLFTPEFQRLTLDIYSRLSLLNEEIDSYKFYYEKTFDPAISGENRKSVRENLNQTSRHIERISRQTADKIGIVIEKKG